MPLSRLRPTPLNSRPRSRSPKPPLRKLRLANLPKHLQKAHAFYERHGGKAVVISRFLPIVRTYIPFVAGMAAMDARHYSAFNALGGVLWVGSLSYAGYFFGNIPWIRGNLTAIIVGIIVVSLLPLVIAFLKSRLKASRG